MNTPHKTADTAPEPTTKLKSQAKAKPKSQPKAKLKTEPKSKPKTKPKTIPKKAAKAAPPPADAGAEAKSDELKIIPIPSVPWHLSSHCQEPEWLPSWLPIGATYDQLSPRLRQGIVEVLEPMYRELVLAPRSSLEKSTGRSIVHLLWLEMLEQMELQRLQELGPPDLSTDPLANFGVPSRKSLLEQHLRTIHSKFRASQLLIRIQKFGRENPEILQMGLRKPYDEAPGGDPPHSPWRQRRVA